MEIVAYLNAFIGAHVQVRYAASSQKRIEVAAQHDAAGELAVGRRKAIKIRVGLEGWTRALDEWHGNVARHNGLATKQHSRNGHVLAHADNSYVADLRIGLA